MVIGVLCTGTLVPKLNPPEVGIAVAREAFSESPRVRPAPPDVREGV
jgi:hypothetical protein